MIDIKPNFNKYSDRLVPVIVQDAKTNIVLMLGSMNKDALEKTLQILAASCEALMHLSKRSNIKRMKRLPDLHQCKDIF